MDPIRTLLDKADQALHTLEKFRTRWNQVSTSLSLLEFEDSATPFDAALEMHRGADGIWRVTTTLKPGTWQYKFVVDGNWPAEAVAVMERAGIEPDAKVPEYLV